MKIIILILAAILLGYLFGRKNKPQIENTTNKEQEIIDVEIIDKENKD